MKKKTILNFFLNAYVNGFLVGSLLLVVTFGVPVWIVVALFVIYAILSTVLVKRPPGYTRYVSDKIREWTFRWKWGRLSDGRISPVDLETSSECELSLIRHPSDYTPPYTYCPDCNRHLAYLDAGTMTEIESIIVGNATRRFGKP